MAFSGYTSTDAVLMEKLAQEAGSYIRDKILEEMFTSKIIPLQTVTMADPMVTVHPDHDQPMVLIPVEPGTRAMKVNFRSHGKAQIISAPRVLAAFETIASNIYQKTKEELFVYEKMGMPLTKVIEDRIPYDIEKIIDLTFIGHVDALLLRIQDEEQTGGAHVPLTVTNVLAGNVIQYSIYKGENTLAAGNNDAVVYPMTRSDLGTLVNIVVGKQLKPEKVLITEHDFNKLIALSFEELGVEYTGRTFTEGMKVITQINGLLPVRTLKDGIVRRGNVYVFAGADFFGRFYALGDLDFYAEKQANILRFQARRMVAMSLVNVEAVGKLELYGGSSDPADSGVPGTGFSTDFVPKPEDDLFDINNRVEDGIYGAKYDY